jgi:hypothetical protein
MILFTLNLLIIVIFLIDLCRLITINYNIMIGV